VCVQRFDSQAEADDLAARVKRFLFDARHPPSSAAVAEDRSSPTPSVMRLP
jgi:hypothetical protein